MTWWNEARACVWCDRPFRPKSPKHKTCCDYCSDKYNAYLCEQKRLKRKEERQNAKKG